MNHQEVIDALERLQVEYSAAFTAERARIAVERERLRNECGSVGHFFAKHRDPVHTSVGRCCVFCGAPEPKAA